MAALFIGAFFVLCNSPVLASPITAFSETYRPVTQPDDLQAKVVFYRHDVPDVSDGAAHLYVGQQLHTSLLPNGFSVFCLSPGRHVLGAYLNDAPLYSGKSSELFAVSLKGGKSYFVKVREHGGSMPIAMPRLAAERELLGHREQVHVISRAAVLQDCR